MATPGDAPPALFTADDLGSWLGAPVEPARATTVERVVWGWLKPVLAVADRPSPVPAELFSWAIELGGIAHENPSGMSSKQLGPGRQAFSAERRAEILEGASAASSAVKGTGSPEGVFPPPPIYPDPASW